MRHSINHFKHSEFACRCCGVSTVARPLIFWLDIVRRVAGKPIVINSGYRCMKHNSSPAVKGSPTSRHLIGCAADISIPKTWTLSEITGIFQRLLPTTWEIIAYQKENFLHIGAPRTAQTNLWLGEKEIEI
jgi:uncharacterized protein YcbK (DUF882 family)